MSYKVQLQVVTSGTSKLPQGLEEYADKHDISYDLKDGDGNNSFVTFEAQDRQSLEDMIKQAYSPDDEGMHQQYIEKIEGDGTESDGESYLTYGTPEPRSEMDIHKPAEGEPDTQLEEAKAAQSGQDVGHEDTKVDPESDKK